MKKTLCFDFGNTLLKCGVFTNDSLTETIVLKDSSDSTLQTLLEKYTPQQTILSSVINHNQNIEQILAEKSLFHKLNSQSKLPFTTPVDKPETIGADRLALAAAASYFYKEKNNLVIASGSCVTYNFINKYNQFIGGSISPGMNMRFASLNTFTAKLPLIKIDTTTAFSIPLTGYDTKTNIISGVVMGLAFEIDGVINAYHEKFNNLNVIITGGYASYFSPFIKSKIISDADFIFKGLYAISEANQ